MVVALQTADESVPVRLASSGVRARLSPLKPLRPCIEGLASALGGLVSPTRRFSVLHGREEESFLWAVGHHPFGPLSATSGVSLLLRDTAHRNAVFSRLDTALSYVVSSLAEVEEFAREFLSHPAGAAPLPRPLPTPHPPCKSLRARLQRRELRRRTGERGRVQAECVKCVPPFPFPPPHCPPCREAEGAAPSAQRHLARRPHPAPLRAPLSLPPPRPCHRVFSARRVGPHASNNSFNNSPQNLRLPLLFPSFSLPGWTRSTPTPPAAPCPAPCLRRWWPAWSAKWAF